jgi:hypothetical protein
MGATRVVGFGLLSVLFVAGCGAPSGDGHTAPSSSALATQGEQVTPRHIATTRVLAKAGGPKLATEAEVRAFLKKMNKGADVAPPNDAALSSLLSQISTADPSQRRVLVGQFHHVLRQLPTQQARRQAGEKLLLALNGPAASK